MVSRKEFYEMANNMFNQRLEGVFHVKVGEFDGMEVAIVVGWSDDYDRDEEQEYQYEEKGHVYTLCAKVAVNIDDFQCDYDLDWEMPRSEDGTVYDTDGSIYGGTYDWLLKESKDILEALEKGKFKVGE